MSDTAFIRLDAEGNQIVLEDVDTAIPQLSGADILILDVMVFPNPADEYLAFKTHLEKSQIAISIYDLQGRLLKTSPSIEQNLSVADLSEGIYVYKLTKKGKLLQSAQFVKQ